MNRIIITLSFLSFLGILLHAQEPNWQLINSQDYPSLDIGVATYNVMDHGADNTGVNSSQTIFQNLLNKLGQEGGGVLFAPAGKYKLTYGLVIPKGVSLRGEWKKPIKGQPIEGTILMATETRIEGYESETYTFITMEPSTSVSHLSIWYPNQTPDKIKKFPPTIVYGKQNYWGNDYCNVRHITLVNSYTGIVLSRSNGGGCPNIYDVYGTPLSRGIEIDNIADVGRFEWIDFSPEYWAGSGLPNSPAKGSAYADWIYNNGTGFIMRRNDWSYTCYLSIDGYKTGFYAGSSHPNTTPTTGNPNGHNYEFTLKNCQTGIQVEGVANAGIMFTRAKIENCENGVVVAPDAVGPLQLYACDISASKTALSIDESVSTKVMAQECTFRNGKVNVMGGVFSSCDGDFNNSAPQVYVGPNGRTVLTGNRFAQEANITDNSLFECVIDHAPVQVKKLPAFPETKALETKPARAALYNVFDFGAKADATTDNTQAIQSALDKAKNEGGGIVYLPPGKYKVLGNLVVPTGVELKGASDLASVPKGPGSILEVYAGKGNADGTPFLKLSERSGIRGVTFNYPEQVASMLPNVNKYPYCIQGTGKDIYVVNVGIRATYNGLDLFTYKCDNHYVDYLAGHAFNNAIRIGGGSENGKVYNMQFNTIVYANGYETKFGSWPNSIQEYKAEANDQNLRDFKFIIVGDCKDQILYNDFHCIAHNGIIFQADNGKAASGISLGLGIDAALRSASFQAIDRFDFINSQIVAPSNEGILNETRFFETSSTFDGHVTFFSADFWGGAKNGMVMQNGTIDVILPNFATTGTSIFLNIEDEKAKVNILNGCTNSPARYVKSGKESCVTVESCVTNPTLATTANFAKWHNNLSLTPIFKPGVTLSRTGWTATASHNNGNAWNAIDGGQSSRWSPNTSQAAGQWIAIDMKTPTKINKIILDTTASPNDGPAGYKAYVSSDGVNWGEAVQSGGSGSAVLVISIPDVTTRHFKIEQTGTKTNYWSVHELYVAYTEDDGTGIELLPISSLEDNVYYHNGILYLDESICNNTVFTADIYDMSGQKVISEPLKGNTMEIRNLEKGLYIVVLSNGEACIRKKITISK